MNTFNSALCDNNSRLSVESVAVDRLVCMMLYKRRGCGMADQYCLVMESRMGGTGAITAGN